MKRKNQQILLAKVLGAVVFALVLFFNITAISADSASESSGLTMLQAAADDEPETELDSCPPAGRCDPGGCGAESCTISQTYPGGLGAEKSVTAQAGYFACCWKDAWGNLKAKVYKNTCC